MTLIIHFAQSIWPNRLAIQPAFFLFLFYYFLRFFFGLLLFIIFKRR